MSAARGLSSRAAAARSIERRLQGTVAGLDSEWNDQARRDFDRRYLDQIRADARQLGKELADLSAELAKAASTAEV